MVVAPSVSLQVLPVAAGQLAQAPKLELAPAVAVSVTAVPEASVLLQVGWQLTPAGLEVTVPVPVPVSAVFSAKVLTGVAAKVAVTLRAAVNATTQVLLPEQPAPLQPLNEKPEAGCAVNVTCVPWS